MRSPIAEKTRMFVLRARVCCIGRAYIQRGRWRMLGLLRGWRDTGGVSILPRRRDAVLARALAVLLEEPPPARGRDREVQERRETGDREAARPQGDAAQLAQHQRAQRR